MKGLLNPPLRILFLLLLLLLLHLEDVSPSNAKEESLQQFASLEAPSGLPVSRRVTCSVVTPPATDAADISILLRYDLAPHASRAFEERVRAGFYDGCYVFRVLKGFVAQWGFNPRFDQDKRVPERRHWKRPERDTAAAGASGGGPLSNTRGTLSFAGSSAVQVFVNLGDNRRLDKEGGRPFAELTEASMRVLDALDVSHKDGEGQIKAIQDGDAAVAERFPGMSHIGRCTIVGEDRQPTLLRGFI